MSLRVILLLLLITVSEATIGVFVKLVDGRIPIQTLNFYALACAAAFLAFAMPQATGQRLRLPRGNVRDTVRIGALIAAQISVFNYAMTLAPIANVVIFWSVAPFFVFLFSAAFLGEPARRSYLWIFAVALAGIALARPLEGGHLTGNLVALGDGAVYAAMITYMRYEGKTEASSDIFWSMLAAAALLAPSPWLFGFGDVLAPTHVGASALALPAGLWAVALGVGSTGFAYFGIALVLQRLDANVYSLVDIIVSPLVAATLGYLVFGEVPAPGMMVGGALLLGAGFWLTRAMAKRDPRRAAHATQSA